jgi:alkylation response protein AidB-like acyl-CoA dehydrogenase
LAVVAVREDDQDHHVGFSVFLVPREAGDLFIELVPLQVLLDFDLKVEAVK